MKKGISIVAAKYHIGYKIKITFSDGKINVFDYSNLVLREHEESLPYRDINKFKKFKIINDTEIAWGNDWDMLLPLKTIYEKSGFSAAGRKSIEDKKILLRLYINKSVIDANGGIENAQKKATDFLIAK